VSTNIPVQNVMKETFNWEVPVETVPIPSEGRVYAANSAVYGKQTLDIKAMTAQEEDILASRALIQQGTVITHLIQSCLVDKSVNVRDMLLGDRNALMVAVRITGYGSSYSAESLCPECTERSEQNYNLTELEIKRLEIHPVRQGENLFEFTLPITKKKVEFKFLTGADDEERNLIMERKKKMMPHMQIEGAVTSKLDQQILSVDGVRDKNQVGNFVRNMPARDSRALRTYIQKHEPGIDMNVWMKCPHCSESSHVSLPIGGNFFWPDE